MNASHLFRPSDPDPKPPGYAWWKDNGCRATCSCGWTAHLNSASNGDASDLWYRTHATTIREDRSA